MATAMEMRQVVSVIVPAYNAATYVGRAIQSLVTQSYQDLELIVVDDGSTDGTADVVNSFKDSRILYCHQNNAGQGAARNAGIARCGGRYVTFLDADDRYLPKKIERQVEYLRDHAELKVCYCNALHYYAEEPGKLMRKIARGGGGNILPELLRTSFVNLNTVMMSREVLEHVGGFNETRYYPEEWDLWLRIALAGYEFGYLDEDLAIVEIRRDSNTSMQIQPTLKLNALLMFEQYFAEPVVIGGQVFSAEKTIRNLKFKLAMTYLVNGERREFRRVFTEACPVRSLGHLLGASLATVPRTVLLRLWKLNQLRHSQPVGRS